MDCEQKEQVVRQSEQTFINCGTEIYSPVSNGTQTDDNITLKKSTKNAEVQTEISFSDINKLLAD
jgi:hypothetical protein